MQDEAWAKYLKEGLTVNIVTWEGKTISVDLPNTVELQVAECDPGVKGNTQSGMFGLFSCFYVDLLGVHASRSLPHWVV